MDNEQSVIEDLNEEIDDLKDEVSELEEEVSDLKDELEEANNTIEALESEKSFMIEESDKALESIRRISDMEF